MAPLLFGERWGALGAMGIVTLALALTPVLATAVRRKPGRSPRSFDHV